MYNVGDSVKLKDYKNVEIPKHIVTHMYEYLGMNTKIRTKTKLDKIYVYALDECVSMAGGWWWREEDFVNENEMNIFESEDFEI